ncbi:MAG: hypothetical protein WC326_12580 [Candidatus Delongbacteria bacterium]
MWPALAGLLVLLSCSLGSRDQVLGVWVNRNPHSKISRLEFRADNSLLVQLEGLALSGRWKVINKYRVKVQLAAVPNQMAALETLIAIDDSLLAWTMPDNAGTQEFRRGK